jgi:peptidoglycan/xylan/chitin deacetylase (PgdA/CDA1 family)
MERLRKMLLALVPHPAAMYEALEEELPHPEDFVRERELTDCYAGMTVEQIAELSANRLFSIGGHTIDHPFLTMCEPGEALRQIQGNRAWLEEVCGRNCDAIAYPSGEYNAGVLDMCREAGFSRGYAVSTRLDRTSQFEMSRIGIYSESTDVLGFKVRWGSLMRDLRIPVG